ncbi:MAG: hypothetical protein KatS3mg057_2536 [Herpetosiphonaceae bacterium]|nr:MAG: hypothetical protein KatS3mg057_2536 [Herpetosiphonaceae bacterium]
MELFAVALAGVLALVHVFAGKLRFLDVIPRSRWLSIAGGVSVAYVFMHIFPELSKAQRMVEEIGGLGIAWIEDRIYFAALAGLALFYGLERLAKQSRRKRRVGDKVEMVSYGVFWLHVVSFAIYNALIGYLLLHRPDRGVQGLLIFFFAMTLHVIVNDYGLRDHYTDAYKHSGRWILAAAVLIGAALGALMTINEAVLAFVFALVAGGVILNVLKEELPEERESSFWAFALGAVGYAAVLLVL